MQCLAALTPIFHRPRFQTLCSWTAILSAALGTALTLCIHHSHGAHCTMQAQRRKKDVHLALGHLTYGTVIVESRYIPKDRLKRVS